METINGVTFTTKQESLKILNDRTERAYYKHMKVLKGQKNASKLAVAMAEREIHKPACGRAIPKICAGVVSYIVAGSVREVKKKYFWLGFVNGYWVFTFDDKVYISTGTCPRCAAFDAGRRCGLTQYPVEEDLAIIDRGNMTDEEGVEAKKAFEKGLKSGANERKSYQEGYGTERYKPRRRK